jgi:folate-binding protein YgfZ
LHYGDWEAEYAALTRHAGMAHDLVHGLVEMTGNDRALFLNRLATNKIEGLPAGGGCEAFLTNAKGHILHYLAVLNRPDSLLLLTFGGQPAKLLEHLDHYLIRDQVELRDRSRHWAALIVAGPEASALLAGQFGSPVPSQYLDHVEANLAATPVCLCCLEPPASTAGQGGRVGQAREASAGPPSGPRDDTPGVAAGDNTPSAVSPGGQAGLPEPVHGGPAPAEGGLVPPYRSHSGAYLVILPAEQLPGVWRTLREAGARPCGQRALELLRIEAGWPRYGRDLSEDNLPQEVGRDQWAISFTKGCYLGQETVARIDSRGHVNRLLMGLIFASAEVPKSGMELRAGSAVVGEITSAAFSPTRNAAVALGYVRRGHNEPGSVLESAAGPATVVSLPMR